MGRGLSVGFVCGVEMRGGVGVDVGIATLGFPQDETMKATTRNMGKYFFMLTRLCNGI